MCDFSLVYFTKQKNFIQDFGPGAFYGEQVMPVAQRTNLLFLLQLFLLDLISNTDLTELNLRKKA